jgi:hypothetical protein
MGISDKVHEYSVCVCVYLQGKKKEKKKEKIGIKSTI